MRLLIGLAAIVLAIHPALAQERAGCAKFTWPIDDARKLLASPPQGTLASGAQVPSAASIGAMLQLKPLADAGLPLPPERAPAEARSAGFLRIAAPGQPGSYLVTLSDEAWIDVIQNGRYLKPVGFTGTRDCPGVRKSIKVELTATPLVVQISGAEKPAIAIAITPAY